MSSKRRNISLRGLRTFCVAAGFESFRHAAERLHVTASAVSHQVKKLEEELGFKLFERRTRSLRLTGRGKALFRDCEPLIRELEQVVDLHASAPSRKTLRLSLQPFFASELFLPRLTELSSLYPDIDIEVDTAEEGIEKTPVSADISVRLFRKKPADLQADRLFSVRLVAVGSPDLYDSVKLRGKKVVSEIPLIVYEGRPNAWRDWERSSGISIPSNSKITRFGSVISAVRAAEQGVGAVLLPMQLCASRFESGKVVPLFDHEMATNDTYFVVSRKDDADNTAVSDVRGWILQTFEDAT